MTAPSRPLLRRTLATALPLLLTLGGAGLLIRNGELNATPSRTNHALTDRDATALVTTDVSLALSRVFSYTPQTTEATAEEAREVLRGRAADQYASLFTEVGGRAAAQHLTLTSRVVRTGVTRLTDDSAELLVFLDQTSTRKGQQPAHAAAQLDVSARFEDGAWRIVDLTAR